MSINDALRDDTLTLTDDDYFEFDDIRIAFVNVAVDGDNRGFRIVVRPSYTTQAKVAAAVFKARRAPEDVKMDCFHRAEKDIWTINWARRNDRRMQDLMTGVFAKYLSADFSAGWRHSQAVGRARRYYEFVKPYYELGGRTAQQMFGKGYGAYEIRNVGFVWVGRISNMRQVQWCQYLPFEKNNTDIRFYLSHGASIDLAYRLTIKQWDELLPQFLSAFGSVMRGNAGSLTSGPAKATSWSIESLDKGLETIQNVHKQIASPLQSLSDKFLGANDKEVNVSTSANDLWNFAAPRTSHELQKVIEQVSAQPYRRINKLEVLPIAEKYKKRTTRFGTIVDYIHD